MAKSKVVIVEISWIDSTSMFGWQRPGLIANVKPLPCTTAGYLVRDDKTCVTVVQSFSAEGAEGNSLTIPRSCVKSVRRLK